MHEEVDEISLGGGVASSGRRSISPDEHSLGGGATYAGAGNRPPSPAQVSLGDAGTLGDKLGDQETVIDDGEVVDLEARYRVEGTLGRGGMGEVLLALDTRLDRKVAIKRILGESARSKTAISRFITEAKAIAALNHPNIVQIYDYGRAKDGPFLIMEYVDGSSLLDRCREGALPVEEAIDLACQLCDGLAKAHDLGIVHRDIKPANVLLTTDGVPKLTDFGLAKAEASDHQMTVMGAVLGTPDFMPPEQRRDAAEVDARSDLWSLAATLYQMVTGRSPKIIRFRDVPVVLEDVLGKALEDSKDHRFQTARQFRDALRSAQSNATSTEKPISPSGTLQEGQCKACGAVTTDLSKKYCRNPECGASLRVPCLKCDNQIPVWDGVCGECGGNQTKIITERKAEFLKACQEAEERRTAFRFGAAKALLRRWCDVDPSFEEVQSQANQKLVEIELAEKQATDTRDRNIEEARTHYSVKDYGATIISLEAIPAQLATTESKRLLQEARALAQEQKELVAQIKEALKTKAFSGLLDKVTRALEITEGRTDLQKLKESLDERMLKQNERLLAAKASATALAARGQWQKAVGVLESLGEEFQPDVASDVTQYSLRAEESRELLAEIKDSWSKQETKGLPQKISRALELQPSDRSLVELQKSVLAEIERREKNLANARRLSEQHAYVGRWQDAVQAYEDLGREYQDDIRHEIEGLRLKQVRADKLLDELKSLRTTAGNSSRLLAVMKECVSLMPGRDDVRRALSLEEAKINKRRDKVSRIYEQAKTDFASKGCIAGALAKHFADLDAEQKEFLERVNRAHAEEERVLALVETCRADGDVSPAGIARIARESLCSFQQNPASTRVRQLRREICQHLATQTKSLNAVLTESIEFLESLSPEERDGIRASLVAKVAVFEEQQKESAYRPSLVSIIFAGLVSLTPLGVLMAAVRGSRKGVGFRAVGLIFICSALGYGAMALQVAFDGSLLGPTSGLGMILFGIPALAAVFFAYHGYMVLSTPSATEPIPDLVFRAHRLVKGWDKVDSDQVG